MDAEVGHVTLLSTKDTCEAAREEAEGSRGAAARHRPAMGARGGDKVNDVDNDDDLLAMAARHASKYAVSSTARGVREVVVTLAVYASALWWLWAGVAGAGVAAATLCACVVRLFVLFHDAAHGTLVRGRAANDAVARLLSVFCLTPLGAWRRLHSHHHEHFDELGEATRSGQTILFTARQYRAWPAWRRALVRVARHPLVFFATVPLLKFFIQYPLLRGDAFTACGWAALVWAGVRVSPLVPAGVYAAGVTGLLVFHWQHAVNAGFREARAGGAPRRAADRRRAALHGSSCFDAWPGPLRWALCGIGYHHVHHLNALVPSYRLAQCHREGVRLGLWRGVTELDAREALRSLSYTMWDESRHKFVPFP